MRSAHSRRCLTALFLVSALVSTSVVPFGRQAAYQKAIPAPLEAGPLFVPRNFVPLSDFVSKEPASTAVVTPLARQVGSASMP